MVCKYIFIVDMTNMIILKATMNILDFYINLTDNNINSYSTKRTVIFVLNMMLLILVFMMIWCMMISNLKMEIMKALGILNVLPTSHLISNLQFIKEMNGTNLIN